MMTYTGVAPNPNSILNTSGMYGGYAIPPNPIGNVPGYGNMLNLGGMGYNMGAMGGYYNPYATSYYNPYMMKQYQEQAEKAYMEQQKHQSSIMKKLSVAANIVHNKIPEDMMENHLKKYDPQTVQYDPGYFEEQKLMKLMNLHNLPTNHEGPNYWAINVAQETEKAQSRFPEQMSLLEYFEKAGSLYYEILDRESKERQRNLSSLYNKDQYSELVKLHSGSSNYFGSVFAKNFDPKNVSIDDMEVKLPSHLQDEYHMRKRAFIDSILKK